MTITLLLLLQKTQTDCKLMFIHFYHELKPVAPGKYAFINLKTHGMLWKIVYGNAKQFAVIGLKHAKPPVYS